MLLFSSQNKAMQFPIQRLLNRAAWVKIHLYLALFAGFFFALMGLTGSVSVYREELDLLLNPQLFIEQPAGKRQSLDKIMAAVRAEHPNRYGSWTLEMPRSPHGMITAWYDKPRETYFELYAPLMVSVNPYTAEVVASRFWGQTVTTWLLDLHTQLLLGGFGWNAVGILGLMLMVSIMTGLYLWWPGLRGVGAALASNVPVLPAPAASQADAAPVSSRAIAAPVPDRLAAHPTSLAVRVRMNAGMIQLAFDLHRLIGLLSAAALLLLAFTGFQLSYPELLETLVGSSGLHHGETGRDIISTAVPNNRPVALEAAEFIARGPFPRAELRRVTTPAGDSGIYRINLRQDSEINHRHPYTTVWVDRWSGHIKEVRDPAGFNQGERLMSWLWPVHTGEAFGSTGRMIWFLTGMSLFLLYVSGLLRWLHRHGKVRDREVNIAALRPLIYRAKEWLVQAGVMLLRLAGVLLQKARDYAPQFKETCATLWQRLTVMIISRQKRIGTKSRK